MPTSTPAAEDRAQQVQRHIKIALCQRLPVVLGICLATSLGSPIWESVNRSLGPDLYPTLEEMRLTVGMLAFFYAFYNGLLIQLGIMGSLESPVFRARLSRGALAVAMMIIALRAGCYAHMCRAGSALIEGTAMLGTPLLVGGIVWFTRRRALGCAIALVVIVTVWLLKRPYLDWAHGN